jgi:hypothetical protein
MSDAAPDICLNEEGLTPLPATYAARDVIQPINGPLLPQSVYRRSSQLCFGNVAVAVRPG